MSQITVLGFTPSQLISSSQGDNAIHWSILLNPTTSIGDQQRSSPSTTRPKARSFFSSQRHVSKDGTINKDTSPESSALFDMHRHQLRQQEFPRPIKSSSPDPEAKVIPTTTSISSDIPNKPYTLSLRILLATHHLPVSKLATKVSTLLYRTPTYGPEEDWLRAALGMLVGNEILEPATSFDADNILAFAGEAVKEYLTIVDQHEGRHDPRHEVLDLDYAKHVREMDSVRAMFSRDPPLTPAPPPTSQPAYALRTSSHSYFPSPNQNQNQNQHRSNGAGAGPTSAKTHKFFGFRVSPSPNSTYSARQRWNSVDARGDGRGYYAGRDDPYGGLM